MTMMTARAARTLPEPATRAAANSGVPDHLSQDQSDGTSNPLMSIPLCGAGSLASLPAYVGRPVLAEIRPEAQVDLTMRRAIVR